MVEYQVKLPETPLVLAGAVGGPFAPQPPSRHACRCENFCLQWDRFGIFFLTPLRNALTLASQSPDGAVLECFLLRLG